MKRLILIFLALLTVSGLQAQDSQPIREIFYGTRAINLMTTSQVGKKVLAYRISHRFGPINSGLYNLIGLDGPANISLAFDYGITDDLMIGVARDGFNKTFNGFAKYNILNQTTDNSVPLTLAVYGRANMVSLRDDGPLEIYDPFANRFSYISQVMVSRKFGERLAVQVAPTFIHRNLVNRTSDANSMIAVSALAQFKINKRLGISGEYTYLITSNSLTVIEPGTGNIINDPARANSASIGLDIVTGGHVFQICLSNSEPINEVFALPYTRSKWFDGDFRLGFNISRKFWL